MKDNTNIKSNCYLVRIFNEQKELIEDIIFIDKFQAIIVFNNLKTPLITITREEKFSKKALFNIKEASGAIIYNLKTFTDDKNGFFTSISLLSTEEINIYELMSSYTYQYVFNNYSKLPKKSEEEIFKIGVDKIITSLRDQKDLQDKILKSISFKKKDLNNINSETLSAIRDIFNYVTLILMDTAKDMNIVNLPVQLDYEKPDTLKYPINRRTLNYFKF